MNNFTFYSPTYFVFGKESTGIPKEILTQMKINFPNKLISCKIRLLEDNKKFEFLIENLLQSNIDFISIHFRYKEQN